MQSMFRILIVAGAFSLIAPISHGAPEIVIAIRYLQAQDTSNSHLYLHRADGKLLRQLTSDNSGQDPRPIFAPDGATIVFTREKPGNVREFWSIDPRGTGLKKAGSGARLVHPREELALFHKRRTEGINIAESDRVIRGIRVACRDAAAKLQIAGWFRGADPTPGSKR
jgi:hypothetical protein